MTKTVICVDLDRNIYPVEADTLRWRPSAYGIVIYEGKILLCRHFGKHNLPGGGIELGETPEEAVVREVKEETGLNVKPRKLLAVETEFFCVYGEGGFAQVLLLYYVCDFIDGELSTDGFDEYEKEYAELAEWVPIGDVDGLQICSTKDFRPHVKKVIDKAL